MTEQTKTNLQPVDPVYIVAANDMQLPIDGSANKRKPESIYETQGWDEGLPFDCSTVNYIWNNHGKWINFLNKQRPLDLQPILDKLQAIEKQHAADIKTLTDKHNTDIDSANDRMAAMQIKVGGYYHGGSVNPATHLLYGTWVKLDADLTLRSANTDGNITGENDPAVPLKKHKHTVTITNAGEHEHGLKEFQPNTENQDATGCVQTLSSGSAGGGATKKAGSHTHTATCTDTGEDTPTLNVRGKHIPCVIWKRTA